MKDLIEIANLLSVQKLRQIEIVSENIDQNSKSDLLFAAIRDGMVTDDEEAIKYIYPNSNNPKPAYLKLKYRLKEKMLNTLFFIDIQNYSRSPIDKARGKVSKTYAAAQLLFSKKKTKSARNLLESVLKTCVKYDFVEYKLLIYKELRKKYGLFNYDKRKYRLYNLLFKETKAILDVSELIEEHYIQLARKVSFSKSLIYSKEIKEIEDSFNPLYQKTLDIDDFFTRYFAYNSKYYLLMFKEDLEAQSRLCDEALCYFETKIGFSPIALFSFLQKKGLSMLQLGKPKESLVFFDKCLLINSKLSLGYLALHNYKFTANIILKKYSEAYKITSTILYTKGFKSISKEFQQPWYIREAYIHFLVLAGKIDPEQLEAKALRKFRQARFINEVHEFSKDKAGLNVTIHIVQVLLLLMESKYDKAGDKLTSLKQYTKRHLKPKKHVRQITFLKMLDLYTENHTELDKVKQKSLKQLMTLKKNPQVYSEQSIQTEIIPFEHVWQLLLETRKKQKSA